MKHLCFDVGGTTIKAGIVDDGGRILARAEEPTLVSGGREAVLRQLVPLSKKLLEKSGPETGRIAGIGVGIPGFVEDGDFIAKAPNLSWENVYIKDALEELLGLPVLVLNDANAAALGEMWQGAGRGCLNLLCLTVGTGIGAGVIIGGKIYTGAKGLAGEIGHLQVRVTGGRQCNCGKTGCLETESSGSALVYYGEEAIIRNRQTELAVIREGKGRLSPKDIVEAADKGDQLAKEIIDQAASYLGLTLANIYLVVAPQKIIIGGGVAQAGDTLFNPLIRWFNRFALKGVRGEEVIVPAKLGNDAGITGLAYLVKQNQGSSEAHD
jgi:glucokinase